MLAFFSCFLFYIKHDCKYKKRKVKIKVSEQENKPVKTRKVSRKRDAEKAKPAVVSDWTEKVVQISRVTKVVKGGKKLSFRAVVVVGDKKGQVGIGVGKSSEVVGAIQKAIADGRKNAVKVPLFKTTVPHPMEGKAGAGKVVLRPASEGTGIIAGGAVRPVLELAGVQDILAKSLGSKSPLNASRATLDALSKMRYFKNVAQDRNLDLNAILN